MDTRLYQEINDYKTTATYPAGLSKNEKSNFGRKANTFDVQGKTMLTVLWPTQNV